MDANNDLGQHLSHGKIPLFVCPCHPKQGCHVCRDGRNALGEIKEGVRQALPPEKSKGDVGILKGIFLLVIALFGFQSAAVAVGGSGGYGAVVFGAQAERHEQRRMIEARLSVPQIVRLLLGAVVPLHLLPMARVRAVACSSGSKSIFSQGSMAGAVRRGGQAGGGGGVVVATIPGFLLLRPPGGQTKGRGVVSRGAVCIEIGNLLTKAANDASSSVGHKIVHFGESLG
mmetsp:Transcript_13761/g.31741  ORF Transcript_13761/g.31741 Transcript_13761/m.31741 type:complete len:229 (-) Transcript_13761:1169-1855(-)